MDCKVGAAIRDAEGSTLDSTLLELLSLPEANRIVFERPPLVLAICQVRFSRVLSIVDGGFVAPFQRAIQRQYPVVTSAQEVSFELGGIAGQTEIRLPPPSFRWQFTDPGQNWTVVLAEDFCAIESRAYDHFDHFLDRLRRVVEALTEHIQPEIGVRIGLRYINEIRPDGASEISAIEPQLLGPLAVSALTEHAEQVASVQQVVLRYQDNQGVNIHHGRVQNGSTVKPRPGDKAKEGPFYLLDFDVFREFPLPDGLSMEPDLICRHVDTYHQVIDRLFRWAVTEEYVSTLGVRRHVAE